MKACFDFTGKNIVVCGAGSGMGRSFAEELSNSGATVFAADLNKAAVDEFALWAKARGRAAYVFQMDGTDRESVYRTAEEVAKTAGRIDGYVCSIGIGAKPRDGEELVDTYTRVLTVDLTGVSNCSFAFGEQMIKTGGGSMVNICSMSGTIIPRKNRPGRGGEYGLIGYCTAKGGVKQLTKAIGTLWASYGIRANTVSPGYVDTPLTAETQGNPTIRAAMEATVPVGYLAQPKDINGTVLFLLSDNAKYITGQDFLIDGGTTSV